MKTKSLQELQRKHQAMLDFQKEIAPFTPTVRDLMNVFGLASTSAVAYTLEQMREQKMVITRISGKSRKYYAV